MSSYVYSTVVLEGNIHELESLRDTMLNLKDKDCQSTFYDILLQHLGIPTENIHCYGDLQGCEIENGTLMWYDHCNTSPCVDVYKLLERHISGGRIYFECTEFEEDLLCTNDAEGKYFKARYIGCKVMMEMMTRKILRILMLWPLTCKTSMASKSHKRPKLIPSLMRNLCFQKQRLLIGRN